MLNQRNFVITRLCVALISSVAPQACSSGTPEEEANAALGTNSQGGKSSTAKSVKVEGCAPSDTFSYAICTCENLTDVGQLIVGAGPSGSGSIGVNGTARFANHLKVDGSVVITDDLWAATGSNIQKDVHVGHDLNFAGGASVEGNVSAGGRLLGAGLMSVGGTLNLGGANTFLGVFRSNGVGAYKAMPAPCGCGANQKVNVQAVVKAAAEKARAGDPFIASGALIFAGASKITLHTGQYVFTDVAQLGRGKLVIDGNVVVYVTGDLLNIGYNDIEIRKGSTLDLYVAGRMTSIGYTPLGNPGEPSAFRLFVGGAGELQVAVGKQDFYGSIYAPNSKVVYVGDTLIEGSIIAQSLTGLGRLIVRHGGAKASCELPPTKPVPMTDETPPQAPPPAPKAPEPASELVL
jgi:hypothetical protein